MQLGKMYLVKDLFWLLFPTKEVAGDLMAMGWDSPLEATVEKGQAYQEADYISEHMCCDVAVVEENTCFVLLEQDEKLFKLLDCNGNIGWIWCRCLSFSKYFELVKE